MDYPATHPHASTFGLALCNVEIARKLACWGTNAYNRLSSEATCTCLSPTVLISEGAAYLLLSPAAAPFE